MSSTPHAPFIAREIRLVVAMMNDQDIDEERGPKGGKAKGKTKAPPPVSSAKGGKKGPPPAPSSGRTKGTGPPLPPSAGKGGKTGKSSALPSVEFEVRIPDSDAPRGEPERLGLHMLGTQREIVRVGGLCAAWNDLQEPQDRILPGDLLVAIDGNEKIQIELVERWYRRRNKTGFTTLTIRRRTELRTAMSLAIEGDLIVGCYISGDEAFSLPAQVASATTSYFLLQIAKALGCRPEDLTLSREGVELEDFDNPGDVGDLLLVQRGKLRNWHWSSKKEEGDNLVHPSMEELAESLPVDYTTVSFQSSRSMVNDMLKRKLDSTETDGHAIFWNRSATMLGATRSTCLERRNQQGNLVLGAQVAQRQEEHAARAVDVQEARAEALPVDVAPLPSFEAARNLIRGWLVPVPIHMRVEKVISCDFGLKAEAAARLRCATLAAGSLSALEALMLKGEVIPTCAKAANVELIVAMIRWERWDDVYEYATLLLSEDWHEQQISGVLQRRQMKPEGLPKEVARMKGRDHADVLPHERADFQASGMQLKIERDNLRVKLGNKNPGFAPPTWPMGSKLSFRKEDIVDMLRVSLKGLVAAAQKGHSKSLKYLKDLLETYDANTSNQYRAEAISESIGVVLALFADDDDTLPGILLRCLHSPSCAYAALKRLSCLPTLPDATSAGLRDTILMRAKLVPRTGFCIILDTSPNWINDPLLLAEAQKHGIPAADLLRHIDVQIVNRYGLGVSDNERGVGLKIKYPAHGLGIPHTSGGWDFIAPYVVKLLRRCHASLVNDVELISALCRLSSLGAVESRCLALEALALVAPPGCEAALEAACSAAVAADAALRTQAAELLELLASQGHSTSAAAHLKAKRDAYADLLASRLSLIDAKDTRSP
eukprot:TRINITY_DN23147_c0_g1_i2.p1 TRINITY_DN23147_c0_g1~~TRINITY_DN23147_c0_g1_i2.p1  ORF type:complete len:886 (-),score=142.42 TRINITY_DN23147_c0_g1_i2:255-2912(-)